MKVRRVNARGLPFVTATELVNMLRCEASVPMGKYAVENGRPYYVFKSGAREAGILEHARNEKEARAMR